MFNLLNKKIGKKNKKGFTLIELVVVIAIVAVLAAVGIPAIAGQVKKSQDSAAASNANLIATAAAQMLSENEAAGLPLTDPGYKPTITTAMKKAGIATTNATADLCNITYSDVKDPADSTKTIGYQVESVKFVAKNGKSTGTFSRS